MSKTATITRQTKAFPFQAKDFDDEKGIVRGYLSTFNNVDEGGDRVLPGAFKRTLQNKYEYKKTNNKRYIMPLLWQHDPNTPIGGYTEAKEDSIGLFVELELDLDVQKGKEAYSALKKGYVFQQSIGYDSLQSENTKVNGQWVRDLIEVRLWEGSIVVFPMNQEAVVTDVKSASGKTSWPLADRDTKWDAGQAKKDIQDWGGDDWGKVAQCFFWVAKSPPEKLGDCKLPFVAKVGDKMMAIPQGVISGAGVIEGAMGGADIDDVEGVKNKISIYYKKMNMTPPWEDDDKSSGRHMNTKNKDKQKEKKTVLEHFADETCQDLLEDWQDVYICALTKAILDAFKIGDQPEQDVSEALDQFKQLVLSKFVSQAVECNLADYISNNGYSYSSADYTMQYGSDSKPNYGYMSNDERHSQKAGRPASAAKKVAAHVENIKSMAKEAKAKMQEHTDAIHEATDKMVSNLTGDGKSINALHGKAGRSVSAATAQAIQNHADTMHDHADKALNIMQEHTKAVRTAADDFAETMQGAETPYEGNDPGKPDDDQQEGKSRNAIPSLTHSESTHSLKRTADEEKAIADAIDDLRKVGSLI